jgi:hypothetical protein
LGVSLWQPLFFHPTFAKTWVVNFLSMEVVKTNVLLALEMALYNCATWKSSSNHNTGSHPIFYFFCRGSNPVATDSFGKTPLESAMEQGAITDDELFVMLSEPGR